MLDVFGGSGSTLIAAHKTGRRARIAELDPVYVDRIVRRWQAYANDDAVLRETGEAFDEVVSRRLAENTDLSREKANRSRVRKTLGKHDRTRGT